VTLHFSDEEIKGEKLMEHKGWSYEEFPEFSEAVEGAKILKTTGDEIGVHYIPSVPYAEVAGEVLHLEILQPFTRNNPEMKCPCIVYVQGSAWMKQNMFFAIPLVSNLAKRGYVVAMVEYRHSRIAPFPAQAVDAQNAVRFLKKHAEEYHIDADKMILAGDSSGGHTAMFGGILKTDESSENLFPGISADVKGIVNYYGSCSVMRWEANPTTMNHHLEDSPEGMVMGGVNLRERPDLCEKLSVECNITEDTEIAPVLIFHGTKDRIVNTYSSVDLYRQLKKCGKKASLYLIEGADHGGSEFWTSQVLDIVDAFVKDCLA
jgi:acetyl esterase/lipase